MTTLTLQEALQPQFILDLISRVRPGQGALGSWLGFQPTNYDSDTITLSGPATVSGPTRYVMYRIFNAVRTLMKARAPATGPSTVAENPVGVVQLTCQRMHDKIPLNYEMLGNLSPMIGPNSVIDNMGQDYIRRQTGYLARRTAMAVEFMAAAMMRDSLNIIQNGDDWLMQFTAVAAGQVGFNVPFQIPSGNKSQLNMLGAGDIIDMSWNNPAAPILLHLMKIKAAFAQLSNYPMTDVWINSIMWNYVITNTVIRNTGGSAQTPFAEYTREPERGMDGKNLGNKYVAVLRADPTIRWHIDDDIVSLGSDIDISYSTYSTGTAAKLIPDNMAIFTTESNPEIAKLYLGGEPVVENPGMPAVMRMGHYFWHEYCTQPSVIELISLLNCIPCLYNPLVFAPGTVVFP